MLNFIQIIEIAVLILLGFCFLIILVTIFIAFGIGEMGGEGGFRKIWRRFKKRLRKKGLKKMIIEDLKDFIGNIALS